MLDSAEIARIGLTTATLAGARAEGGRRLTGQVVPEPERTVTLRAPVAGRLSGEQNRWPSLGERLEAGTTVGRVSDAQPLAVPIGGVVTECRRTPGRDRRGGAGPARAGGQLPAGRPDRLARRRRPAARPALAAPLRRRAPDRGGADRPRRRGRPADPAPGIPVPRRRPVAGRVARHRGHRHRLRGQRRGRCAGAGRGRGPVGGIRLGISPARTRRLPADPGSDWPARARRMDRGRTLRARRHGRGHRRHRSCCPRSSGPG